MCNDRGCKCCTLAGKEQIDCDNNNNTFYKASIVLYYIKCRVCNLDYVRLAIL